MVWFKQGVYGELTAEAAEGLRRVEKASFAAKCDVFVTSVRDGSHSAGSLHPSGRAWDMRRNMLSDEQLKAILGKDFDVVSGYESGHVHIEYDPKG